MKKLAEWPSHVLYAVAIAVVGVLLVLTLTGFKVYDVIQQKEIDAKRAECIEIAEARSDFYIKENGVMGKDGVSSMPLERWKFVEEREKADVYMCIRQYPRKK